MSAAQRDPVPDGGSKREPGTEPGDAGSRKARGRPRLTESDRARRRLESRKKYDVRRVYLGEAHGPWVDLRRRSGWSDAKLAAYLLGLERGQRAGRTGKRGSRSEKQETERNDTGRDIMRLHEDTVGYHEYYMIPGAALGGGTAVSPPAGPGPPAEGRVAALEAVLCVPLPFPLRLGAARGAVTEEGASALLQGGGSALLQAPPLLILAGPGYEALEGLQLDVRGGEVSCALLQGQSAFPPDPQLPKPEEDKALALKQEEAPPAAEAEHWDAPMEPPVEPPPEPPPPLPEEDADGSDMSAIIYEIPKEPEKLVAGGGSGLLGGC
ncbi:zinc finger protein 653 [Coturnix japonica]|uniref:zinc finger protein 653 n=1 Tax=Coturnix japonica TaxID=93934 RepID=UPI0013A5C733|nr:zinc finger protein 653 [Coturnix japonica]